MHSITRGNVQGHCHCQPSGKHKKEDTFPQTSTSQNQDLSFSKEWVFVEIVTNTLKGGVMQTMTSMTQICKVQHCLQSAKWK